MRKALEQLDRREHSREDLIYSTSARSSSTASDVLWHIDVGTPVRFPVVRASTSTTPRASSSSTPATTSSTSNRVLPFELPEQTPEQTLPGAARSCAASTPDEIDYLVNSHFHFDHVGGNKYLTNADAHHARKFELRSLLVPEPFERLGYSRRGLVRARRDQGQVRRGRLRARRGPHAVRDARPHHRATYSLLAEPEGRRPMIFAGRRRLHAGDAGQGDHRRLPPRPGASRSRPSAASRRWPRSTTPRSSRRTRWRPGSTWKHAPEFYGGLREERHMGKLEGRVAIVTGGAQGIGRAIVDKLAAEGATVVIADLNGEQAEQAAGGGRRASPSATDISRARPGRATSSTPRVDALRQARRARATTPPSCPSRPGTTSTSRSGAGSCPSTSTARSSMNRAGLDAMRETGYGRIVNICSNVDPRRHAEPGPLRGLQGRRASRSPGRWPRSWASTASRSTRWRPA